MHIAHIEISNFRKLLSARIDLADRITLFVGANNSGKTSAMLAMRRFLIPRQHQFRTHDITLLRWPALNKIGAGWSAAGAAREAPDLSLEAWTPHLPTLDIWLQVSPTELHHVSKLVPTLDWQGGLLGVRLRLEPKDPAELHKAFMQAMADAEAIKSASTAAPSVAQPAEPQKLTLWPVDMMDFLSRRLGGHLVVRSYALDPSKLAEPVDSVAKPQALGPTVSAIDGDPLAGLIRVNEIHAQRGFGETQSSRDDEDDLASRSSSRLSDQLRSYYQKHLDPSEYPEPSDLDALRAIEAAQQAFDLRLTESFKAAFLEVEGLGYPGVTDPKPRVTTRLRPVDGLDHRTAITFEIDVVREGGDVLPVVRLPEANNGLGYQNLISMIFRLMSFRDAWMRVGKAARGSEAPDYEPLQLVLIEEPEAHLHAQVQQVFVKKAYDVLRAHPDLGDSGLLRTQVVVSTHSSHVAHEISYSCLRYFRRLPAGMNAVSIPISVVVNLTNAFGESDETSRFVNRYLRAQHADLFFADALILVEGAAERMLLPHFIRHHFPRVDQGYITMLEVGGSHAHKLKPLVNHLGLTTLVITDLDAQEKKLTPATETTKEKITYHAAQPKLGAGLTSNNDTLKTWLPQKSILDDLLASGVDKILRGDEMHEVCVAYQTPIQVCWPTGTATPQIALPYTFEDALAFENMTFFSVLEGPGLVAKFREAINGSADVTKIGAELFQSLRNKADKGSFALNVFSAADFDGLKVPGYIAEGLGWLDAQLRKKQVELLSTESGGVNA
nr:AAA family ATPase [Bradyrhizobium sp. 2S1]MCK7667580.1 AAA family ATPase [Bradyrhizobium sp. 2S1]